MATKKKTAEELCTTHSGVAIRRQEIILALCRGCDWSAFAPQAVKEGYIGRVIVLTANAIIEETEQ